MILEQVAEELNGLESDTLSQEDDDLSVVAALVVPTGPTPGCAVSFFADNKRHHAMCLAVIGDDLLLEHKGASRCYLFTGKVLEVVPRIRAGVATATILVGSLKTCRYRSLPKKWLQEMVTTGQTWRGIERGGGVAPSPFQMLKGDAQLEMF